MWFFPAPVCVPFDETFDLVFRNQSKFGRWFLPHKKYRSCHDFPTIIHERDLTTKILRGPRSKVKCTTGWSAIYFVFPKKIGKLNSRGKTTRHMLGWPQLVSCPPEGGGVRRHGVVRRGCLGCVFTVCLPFKGNPISTYGTAFFKPVWGLLVCYSCFWVTSVSLSLGRAISQPAASRPTLPAHTGTGKLELPQLPVGTVVGQRVTLGAFLAVGGTPLQGHPNPHHDFDYDLWGGK